MITCGICGEDCTPKGCGTGYATQADGLKVCYSCAGWDELVTMRDTGKGTLYLTMDGENNGPCFIPKHRFSGVCGSLSNWPGTFKINVAAYQGRHNMARTRYDVWFKAFGRNWHGVQYGENTQLCQCRATK